MALRALPFGACSGRRWSPRDAARFGFTQVTGQVVGRRLWQHWPRAHDVLVSCGAADARQTAN